MMFRMTICFLLILLTLTGCSTTQKEGAGKPLYEVYLNTGGNLSYLKIFSLQKGKIDYTKSLIDTRNKNLTLDTIGKATGKKSTELYMWIEMAEFKERF